jgi:hypothetical protein
MCHKPIGRLDPELARVEYLDPTGIRPAHREIGEIRRTIQLSISLISL